MTNKRRESHGTPRVKRHQRKPQNTNERVLRQLKQEARHLGLTTPEYVRLILNMSSTLRTGLAKDREIDGKQLLKWVENPMFLAMIQWVSQYAVAAMNGESITGETRTDGAPVQTEKQPGYGGSTQHPQPQTPQQTAPHPKSPQYPMPMQPPVQQPMQRTAPMQPPVQQPQHHFPNGWVEAAPQGVQPSQQPNPQQQSPSEYP